MYYFEFSLQRGSPEYESACELWALFQDKRKDSADDGSVDDEDASEMAESTDAPTEEEEEEDEDDEDEDEDYEMEEKKKTKPIRPTFKLVG